MYILNAEKVVTNIYKLDLELKALTLKYRYLSSKAGNLELGFEDGLTQEEVDAVFNLLNNFVDHSVYTSLRYYVDRKLDTFVDDFLVDIRARCLEQGMTGENKMYELQALIEKPLDIYNNGKCISLFGTLKAATLPLSLKAIGYMRSNPTIYDGLDPFVTDEVLEAWFNKILQFLVTINRYQPE
jgi:hypothetical protein